MSAITFQSSDPPRNAAPSTLSLRQGLPGPDAGRAETLLLQSITGATHGAGNRYSHVPPMACFPARFSMTSGTGAKSQALRSGRRKGLPRHTFPGRCWEPAQQVRIIVPIIFIDRPNLR